VSLGSGIVFRRGSGPRPQIVAWRGDSQSGKANSPTLSDWFDPVHVKIDSVFARVTPTRWRMFATPRFEEKGVVNACAENHAKEC